MLHTYEVAYLFNPAMLEEKVNEEISKLRLMLETSGGVFLAEELPKVRGLAYEVEKKVAEKKYHFKDAYFGWFRMELTAEAPAQIKKEMDANPNVLRFLLTKVIKYKPLPIRSIPNTKAKQSPDGEPKVEVSDEQLDKEIEVLLSPVV